MDSGPAHWIIRQNVKRAGTLPISPSLLSFTCPCKGRPCETPKEEVEGGSGGRTLGGVRPGGSGPSWPVTRSDRPAVSWPEGPQAGHRRNAPRRTSLLGGSGALNSRWPRPPRAGPCLSGPEPRNPEPVGGFEDESVPRREPGRLAPLNRYLPEKPDGVRYIFADGASPSCRAP